MISDAKGGRIRVDNGWAICPQCNRQRILRVYAETRGKKISCWCRVCRAEILLNIDGA